MKKVLKSRLVTIFVFIIVIAIIFISVYTPKKIVSTDDEVMKCIGERSVLYVQLGCSHCEDQKDILGNGTKYIEMIDCFYERSKCSDIKATPTWKIDGKSYTGVLKIDQLREIAKC